MAWFAGRVRRRPGLVGAFFIDAAGTGMFLPFSLLFFLATTSVPLTRIGLALSAAALVRIPVPIAAGPLADWFGPRAAALIRRVGQLPAASAGQAERLLEAGGF